MCIFAESTMFCIANKNYDSETNKAENEKSKQHAFQLKIYLFQTNFALKTFKDILLGLKYNYF